MSDNRWSLLNLLETLSSLHAINEVKHRKMKKLSTELSWSHSVFVESISGTAHRAKKALNSKLLSWQPFQAQAWQMKTQTRNIKIRCSLPPMLTQTHTHTPSTQVSMLSTRKCFSAFFFLISLPRFPWAYCEQGLCGCRQRQLVCHAKYSASPENIP